MCQALGDVLQMLLHRVLTTALHPAPATQSYSLGGTGHPPPYPPAHQSALHHGCLGSAFLLTQATEHPQGWWAKEVKLYIEKTVLMPQIL